MRTLAGAPLLSAKVAVVEDTTHRRHFLMTADPLPVGAKVELTLGTGHHLLATVDRCAHHGWGIFRVRVQFNGAPAA